MNPQTGVSQPGRRYPIFIVTCMRILYLALRYFIIYVGFAHMYGQLAINRWPAIAEAQFLSQGSPYEVCGGNSGTGTDTLRTVFRYRLSFQGPYSSIIWGIGQWTH
jgi:hypothetical protein